MTKRLAVMFLLCVTGSSLAADKPEVRVEPSHLQGPRALEKQTESAAIRDYLQAWQSMSVGFAQNRSEVLDSSFVGDARDKLAATIAEQAKLGIQTRYQDRAHDIQIVFYSPEGLSIQLIDKVDYDVQIVDHDKPQPIQKVSARYIGVLTPSEVRWRVRILQGE
jgi:hypothetical protein